MPLIIEDLSKRFGDVLALDGVSFTVPDGEVFGFLDANGGGKTTTMRIVLGFLKADAGTVVWNGRAVAVYAATGFLDMHSPWLVALSQVPFVSPFMMLSRVTVGDVSTVEVVLSIGLLLVTIAGALWLAGRIYAAGVLRYGQRPGIRSTWRLIREGM